MSSRGWLVWFLASFGSFLFFEVRALATRHPERTLSDAIWRLEQLRTGQPLYQWSAGHVLVAGTVTVLFVWLGFHFTLGWWR